MKILAVDADLGPEALSRQYAYPTLVSRRKSAQKLLSVHEFRLRIPCQGVHFAELRFNRE